MNLPDTVRIVEVGPRDGLQNESVILKTEDKAKLIRLLADSGIQNIEVASFVSPKWVPQMADGLELVKSLNLPKTVHCSALVPNAKGYEQALAAGLSEIALFMSATESHNKKNINKSTEEALETLKLLCQQAKADRLKIRCYLSVVFVCPYEGKTKTSEVKELIKKLLSFGIDELSLGDTIGAATPKDIFNILNTLDNIITKDKLALHLHDTRGTALANVFAGLQAGISIYDSSIGGMGGCPYAPGAAGNLATEDLVYMLNEMGIHTGINLEKLVDAGSFAQEIVQHKLAGRYLQACLAQEAQIANKKIQLGACK